MSNQIVRLLKQSTVTLRAQKREEKEVERLKIFLPLEIHLLNPVAANASSLSCELGLIPIT